MVQMCASVSKDTVIGYLQLLLKGADLESTTEEILHHQLSNHFQQDMKPFTEDIQAEIENFIVSSAKKGVGPGSKRDRENCDPGASTVKSAKVGEAAGVTKEFVLSEDGLARCNIKEFKGKTYVDIRMHFKKGDDVFPTKKGLMMSIPEWQTLAASIPGLSNAVKHKDLSHTVSLTAKRRVTVSDFIKDTVSVDIREYYGEGEEAKPSPKGILLRAPAFQALCSHADAITAALAQCPAAETSMEPSASAAAASAPAIKAETAAAPLPTAASSAGGAAAPGASTVTTKSGDTMWWLGGSVERNVKLAGVSSFKDKRNVSVREHYQKDGAWMPGKKGLNLTPEQFGTLCSHQQEISNAVAAKNLTLQVALSDSRTVALNEFKSKVYVHIRERSGNGDQQDACRGKGIGLSADEWGKLAAVLPAIQASLN